MFNTIFELKQISEPKKRKSCKQILQLGNVTYFLAFTLDNGNSKWRTDSVLDDFLFYTKKELKYFSSYKYVEYNDLSNEKYYVLKFLYIVRCRKCWVVLTSKKHISSRSKLEILLERKVCMLRIMHNHLYTQLQGRLIHDYLICSIQYMKYWYWNRAKFYPYKENLYLR